MGGFIAAHCFGGYMEIYTKNGWIFALRQVADAAGIIATDP